MLALLLILKYLIGSLKHLASLSQLVQHQRLVKTLLLSSDLVFTDFTTPLTVNVCLYRFSESTGPNVPEPVCSTVACLSINS